MEATAQPPAEDWLAGATIEFGGEIEEQAQVRLEGIELGADEPVS